MVASTQEVKQRYWAKKRAAAPFVKCACGCDGELKAIDEYGRAAQFINGHNGRRYEGEEATRRAVSKRYKKNNPDKIRDGKREYYRRRKLEAMALLGNKCVSCGFKYDGANAPAFEFHHSHPAYKERGITRMLTNVSRERTNVELKKCVLLCANCHNMHHGGRW